MLPWDASYLDDRIKAEELAFDTQALRPYFEYGRVKAGLMALVEKPAEPPLPRRWLKLMDKVPLDPWEREYRLVVRVKDGKEAHFIASQGPDPDDKSDDIEHPVDKPEPEE